MASSIAIDKETIIKEFATHEGDVGSSQVQIALLTARIKYLTEHMKANKKDAHTMRGLVAMVERRRKLQKYMNRTDHVAYIALIKRLGLRR
jgi:small subunit ribosomal protein S15